ncbi:hypothetical protein T09_11949 [Trichinella sp. T9]|nr:hypothetical protein T09_11949 [Trichinella sp. T9]
MNTLVLHKETEGQANKLTLQKLRQMKSIEKIEVERKVQLIQLNYCLNLSGCFDLCRVACQEVKTK